VCVLHDHLFLGLTNSSLCVSEKHRLPLCVW
jgi:hypothetical protein